jgi:hypothetical protein
MNDLTLDKDNILRLFKRLDELMYSSDVQTTIFVVGGAAVALMSGNQRVTTDIDGSFECPELEPLIREIATEEGLPGDWLNHSINVTMSFFKKDENASTVFNGKALSIQSASPEYILAMKLASRRDKDVDDIAMLVDKLDLNTKARILGVVDKYFKADLSDGSWQRTQIEDFIDMLAEDGTIHL